MLSPAYVEVDRKRQPACFIQSDPNQYNDILNNHRVFLGAYQFRRCLFAKTYLYGDAFDAYLRLGFVREPLDRCISQFFYLWHIPNSRRLLRLRLKCAGKLRFGNLTEYNFDLFLDAVESCRSSDSNVHPRGLHFQTHTAKMWDDIVDDEQTVLLNWMFRLEDLNAGVDQVREELRLPALSTEDRARKNAASKMEFTPNAQQRARVKALFAEDFDLYEGYCRSV